MVDYSKWDKGIVVSDDEDDTHPNIDTASLYRWRHEDRLQRRADMEEERKEIAEKKKEMQERKGLMDRLREEGKDVASMEKEHDSNARKLAAQEAEYLKKEETCPWDVDNLSSQVYSKTVINSKSNPENVEASDEEQGKRYATFVKENDKLLKEFGVIRKYKESKQFLLEHPQLVCEDTANHLVLWCITLTMEEELELMEIVSHQCLVMNFLVELGKQLGCDPKTCLGPFFSRIGDLTRAEYRKGFETELTLLRQRIKTQAEEKIKEAIEEDEAEERQARLGPGGLDPLEVFQSLPEELKKCFELKDIPLLQETIENMAPEEAVYHMKRCTDSGLWCPSKDEDDEEEEVKEEDGGGDKDEDELKKEDGGGDKDEDELKKEDGGGDKDENELKIEDGGGDKV